MLSSLSACTTQSIKLNKDKSIWPSKARWQKAIKNAAQDKHTWVPVAAAAATQVGNIDQKLSRWAANRNPIYGSQNAANHASDQLLVFNRMAMWSSTLALPLYSKAWELPLHRAAVQSSAIILTHNQTMALKNLTGRERPQGNNAMSFPSAHTSGSAAFATMGKRNLTHMSLSPGSHFTLHNVFTTAAVGTAWGRVEANVHYPSDVLVGYALGNFFGTLFNDAFLEDDALRISVSYATDELALKVGKQF